jgi:putative endonuclease
MGRGILRCFRELAAMKITSVERGRTGEAFAVKHLQDKGYRILARNYRHRRCEIDIVAWDKGTIVFVEVKSRGYRSLEPDPSPSAGQIKRILVAANSYLHSKAPQASGCRFDLVRIRVENRLTEIEHLEDAFDASSFLV